MTREKKPCARCGEPVDIIPAGVSKTTGKPYGSFCKCKACGYSESLGPKPKSQPQKPAETLWEEDPQLTTIINALREIYKSLEEIKRSLRQEPEI